MITLLCEDISIPFCCYSTSIFSAKIYQLIKKNKIQDERKFYIYCLFTVLQAYYYYRKYRGRLTPFYLFLYRNLYPFDEGVGNKFQYRDIIHNLLKDIMLFYDYPRNSINIINNDLLLLRGIIKKEDILYNIEVKEFTPLLFLNKKELFLPYPLIKKIILK